MQSLENTVSGLILAAGKGTRMGSHLPKVLCELAGETLLKRVYGTLNDIGIDEICLILSEDTQPFEPFLQAHPNTTVCIQHERRGTGDAVASAYPAYPNAQKASYAKGSLHSGPQISSNQVLICYGDTPCLSGEILKDFIKKTQERKAKLAVIGMEHPNPTGYGRIILDNQNQLVEIIEEKDADEETKKVNLCNSGILLADIELLFGLLNKLHNDNAQGEYYLTDCFQLCRDQGDDVFVYKTDQYRTFDGVNTKEQLASLSEWFMTNKN